jgi:hypothetical protein
MKMKELAMNHTPPQKQRADKRILLAVVSLLLSASLVFAVGQTEEDDFQQVDGTGNWEHTIDVSELEPGQYNILVRARDEAGNEAIGGPYNVFVDPDSDLPQLAISYPQQLQRTDEDLFVVGSAWDDDAVGYVEVRINDGAFRRAEGDRFWSLLVPLAALDDGRHTVTARAVDINGVTGPEYSVPFRLDRRGPRSSVSSHESGVLITGRTTIDGAVEDENGVRSLSLVRPDGTERLNLRGREDEPRQFSFQIDPREMEEGPSVWWLESVDGTGALGSAPFLFFVDTSAPELELLYPGPEDRVDAQLRVVGRVRDTVGTESLSYEMSTGESGEIELRPGDPFWTLALDLAPDTRGNVTLTLQATDLAGNVDVQRVRYEIDREGDQPTVELVSPAPEEWGTDVRLTGFVSDDDGPASVFYSLNGGEPVEINATSAFSIPLPQATPGTNEIEVYAVDQNGLTGPSATRRFQQATGLPVLTFNTLERAESSEDYAPGFVLADNERATLIGSLISDAGLFPARISVAVGATVSTAAVDESGAFSVQLPRGRSAATPRIEAWYENELGAITRTSGYYVQLPQTVEETPAPDPDDLLDTGLYLTTGTPAESEDVPQLAPVAYTVNRQAPLLFRAVGGRPSDIALDPEVDFLSVRGSADRITLSATGDGYVDSVRIVATVGGRTVRSGAFAVRSETEAPALSVSGLTPGDYIAAAPEIIISATDDSGLLSVEAGFASASAEAPRLSTVSPSEEGYTVTPRLPAEDGPALLTVRAVDAAGAIRTLEIPVIIDRAPQTASIIAPAAGETVNGTVSVVAIVNGAGVLAGASAVDPAPDIAEPTIDEAEAESSESEAPVDTEESGDSVVIVSEPEAEKTTLSPDAMIVHQFSVSADDPSVQFALIDRAGNEGTVETALQTDDSADRPQLTVQLPAEGGVVVDDFRLSGVLLDDDEPVAVEYAVNDGEMQRVSASGPFDRSLDMSGLADGVHTIAAIGYDLEGVASEAVVRTFTVSRTAPTIDLVAPSIESFQRGVVELSGTAEDPNSIDYVEVSSDGGASFQRARGAEGWRYKLDTTLFDDGTHSVLIRATDTAGMSSLFTTTINVDNTAPVLELALPSDGETVSSQFLIDGRAEDAAFDQIRLVLQPLDRAADPIELAEFDEPGPFAYSVNASALAPGWYNLRVEASDRAGNARRISQNLRFEPAEVVEVPEIVLPLDGATLAGDVSVVVRAPAGMTSVPLYLDNRRVASIELDGQGRGTTVIAADAITDGERRLSLEPIEELEEVTAESNEITVPADGDVASSEDAAAEEPPADDPSENSEPARTFEPVVHTITYRSEGPWLTIAGPAFDAFVRDRPFLTGTAGYALELPEATDGDDRREREQILRDHALERVEVSSDNGQTWVSARGAAEWRHRIETTELPDGDIHYIVRAVFANGETAVVRHTVVVDEQPPEVRLLAPAERDTFDESITVVGATADDNVLGDVAVVLRPGDKSSYELPSFIQGLYIDVHALGATYFDIGAGLSFFDDNVRLQAQIGVSPPGRFSGLVLGTKLLANIASIPASFVLGPDYEWLSAAITLGANFSYFTMSEDSIAFTDQGLVLAGMVAQLEFPVITLEDLPLFNTYSLYTEYQLWFISSDVEAGTAGRLAFGLRLNLF